MERVSERELERTLEVILEKFQEHGCLFWIGYSLKVGHLVMGDSSVFNLRGQGNEEGMELLLEKRESLRVEEASGLCISNQV